MLGITLVPYKYTNKGDGKVRIRVAWIQDMDPMTAPGGAQLTDRTHIFAGFDRGHHIQVVVPRDNLEVLGERYDVAVISNAMDLKSEHYQSLRERGIPYVFFPHDFGPWVCKWRLFYSMEERCKTLCYLRDRWRDVLMGGKGFVWLSPLHRQAWYYAYPELKSLPGFCVPSPVEPDTFFDLKQPRKGLLAVNEGVPYKGGHNLRAWVETHPSEQIVLVDMAPGGMEFPPNVEVRKYVPYHQMNELYNSFEGFIHLPANIMPFERTVAEAYLAGCRIIGNKNIGALSYSWFKSREKVVANLKRAPGAFWGAIESCLGKGGV